MSLILDEVYYQNLIQGRSVLARKPVVAATTANITLSGTQTIDGIAVIAGNRVLVKNQTDQKQNGIYDVASGSWTRSQDFDTGNASGINVFVSGGTLNGNQLFYCNNFFGSDTIGTHNLTFDVLVTSSQSQTLFNESFVDNSTLIVDSSDSTKKVRFEASGITANTTRVLNLPNIDSTLATTADLSGYVANTELKTKINALPVSDLTAINSAIGSKVSLSGDESISGNKTFNNNIIVSGNASGDSLTLNGSSSTGIILHPHGTASGNTKSIQFRELAANGTHSVSIKAPDSITTYTLTLPASQSAYSMGVLQANTSGAMSFDDGATYVRTTGDQSIAGNKTFTDSITTGNLTINGTISLSSITTTGAASAGSLSISGTTSLTGSCSASSITASGSVSAGSLSVSGTSSLTGSCSASSISASGSVSAGSLSVSGTSSLTGNVSAGSLAVSGSASALSLTLTGTTAGTSDLALGPFGTSSGNTRALKFQELTANGTEFVGIKAPDSIASSYSITLPPTVPVNATSYLVSNTSGELSWGIAPSGGGTGGISGDASLTSLAVSGTSNLAGTVTAGNLSVGGTSSLASVSVSGTTSLTGALSAGAITASGSVSAGSLSVSGTTSLTGSCSASSISASGAVSAGSLTVSGSSSALSLVLTGTTAGTSDLALGPFGTSAGNTRSLKFQELAANGSNFVGIKAPDTLASDVTLTLPDSNPATSGSLLSASTSGALSWTNPGSFVDLTTANQTITAAKSFTGNLTSNKIIVSGTAAAIEDAAVVLEPYGTSAQQARSVLFRGLAASGTQYVGVRAPDSISSTYNLTLPNALNAASAAMMVCNTNGSLSFGNTVSTLSVSGTSSLTGSCSASSITASGAVSVGSLSVSGTTSLTGALTAGAVSAGSVSGTSLSVSGTTSLTGTLTAGVVSAGAVSGSSLSVSGTTSLTGSCSASSITASGSVSVGSLSVSGTTSLTGALTAGAISGSGLSVSGTTSLTGSCSASSISASGAVSAGSLTVSGSSSALSLELSGTTAGTSDLTLGPFGTATGNTRSLKFQELAANGTAFVGIKAPDNLSTNITLTLPSVVSTASAGMLLSDTSGNLSFGNAVSTLSVSGTTSLNGSCSASTITASGAVSAGSLTVSGTSSLASVSVSGTSSLSGLVSAGSLSVSGTSSLASVSVSGTSSLTGTLTAGTINGSAITSSDNLTGQRVILSGTTSSADFGAVTLTPWGTASGNTREIRFRELGANGTGFVGIKAPDDIPSIYRLILPNAVSTFSDGLLSSDTSGNLSYDDASTFVRTTGDQSITGTKTFSAVSLSAAGTLATMNLTSTGAAGYSGLTMLANGNSSVLRALASGDINLISQTTGSQVVIRGGGSGSKTAYFDVTGLGLGGSGPTALLELATDSAKKPNGGSWQSSSDERLKENITTADLSVCYDTVKNIPLRRYRWKDTSFNDDQINGDRHRLGFIAQEYKSYFPKDVLVSKFQKSHDEIDSKTGESKKVVDFEIKDCLSINVDQMLMSNIGAVKKIINETEVRKYTGDSLSKSSNITLGNINHRANIYNGTVIIPFAAQTLAANEWLELMPLSEYKNVAFSNATLLDSAGTEVDRDFKIGVSLQSNSLGTGETVLRVNLLGLGFITKNVNYTLLVNYLIY